MTTDALQNYIDKIAMEAFNKYKIIRDGTSYELAEIEIYVKDLDNGINDIYRHDTDKHLRNAEEYQHYSGFDICQGNKDKKIYCGILVRGLMNDSEAIYGPRRVKYKGRQKHPREIKIKISEVSENRFTFHSSEINSNVILKLPRVNLSNTTSMDNLYQQEELQKYLNLKARYLRVKDKNFFSTNGPVESREIWNVILNNATKTL